MRVDRKKRRRVRKKKKVKRRVRRSRRKRRYKLEERKDELGYKGERERNREGKHKRGVAVTSRRCK
jgi:hypothetical protein